jgi:hypothetical protein
MSNGENLTKARQAIARLVALFQTAEENAGLSTWQDQVAFEIDKLAELSSYKAAADAAHAILSLSQHSMAREWVGRYERVFGKPGGATGTALVVEDS